MLDFIFFAGLIGVVVFIVLLIVNSKRHNNPTICIVGLIVSILFTFVGGVTSDPSGPNPASVSEPVSSSRSAEESSGADFTNTGTDKEPESSSTLSLNAGDFIVGRDIPAGRYVIESDGLIKTESKGKTKIHTYLSEGDGGYTGNLDDGDSLHCSSPATFAPIE